MNYFNNTRTRTKIFFGISSERFSTSQSLMNNKFVFIGAPGVGKGTFAKIICEKQNWFHLSLG
jgi:replication-associated recombination protein RarA